MRASSRFITLAWVTLWALTTGCPQTERSGRGAPPGAMAR
jgi:hypothetical protein